MRPSSLFRFLCVLGAVTLPRFALAQASPVQRYAIVIGSNFAGNQSLPRLEFADDDALNNCELLSELGMQVSLFTEADRTTQQRWGADETGTLKKALPACSHPRTPYRNSVESELRAIARQVRGLEPSTRVEIVFWFSGHGNGSALLLQDQPLTTVDLQEWLLTPTRGRANLHLILDTCGAQRFALGRDGTQPAEDIVRQVKQYPRGLDLETNAHVGVLIASTASGKVHEWSAFEAGIFSYELRSAFRNAADANGDRRITYREAEAFVWAANSRVEHIDARMNGDAVLPHQGRDTVVVDWNAAPVAPAVLTLKPSAHVHLHVTDTRGVRVAETHKGAEEANYPARLLLRPGTSYEIEVVAGDGNGSLRRMPPSGPASQLELSELPAVTGGRRMRGELELSLQEGLFKQPYSSQVFNIFSQISLQSPSQPWFNPRGEAEATRATGSLAYWLLGAGAAAAGLGAVAYWQSNEAYGRWMTSEPGSAEVNRQRAATERWDWTATISFVAAGAAVAGGVGLVLFDRPRPRRSSVGLSLSPNPRQPLTGYLRF